MEKLLGGFGVSPRSAPESLNIILRTFLQDSPLSDTGFGKWKEEKKKR